MSLFFYFVLTGLASFKVILKNIVLKGLWYPAPHSYDTLCYYSSLHCRVHFEMCDPVWLYGPILLVILINVPPYSIISHSSVIWNYGVTGNFQKYVCLKSHLSVTC